MAQMHYKSVLDVTTLTEKELDKIQFLKSDEDRWSIMRKKQYKPMLFTLFETDIVIFRVKPKERLDISQCAIQVDNAFNPSMTDQSKYQFNLKIPSSKKPIAQGGKHHQYILACNSEQLRKEWIF